MKEKGINLLKRCLVFLITLTMVITLPGINSLELVSAGADYTVTLNVPGINGAVITLTEKDSHAEHKATTENSVATFAEDLNAEEIYKIQVDNVKGYKTYSDLNYKLNAADADTLVLSEMDKVTFSGTVVDEKSGRVNGATVSVTGYTDASTTTNAAGVFSLTLYKGESYSYSITSEPKFEVSSGTVTANRNTNLGTVTLTPHQYDISTSKIGSGTISGSTKVVYGYDKTINIKADSGYEISYLLDNGNPVKDAVQKSQYNYTLTDITEGHTVEVEFSKIPSSVTFTYNENGTLTSPNGTVSNGGSVRADGGNASFTAIPNVDYHVSNINVDRVSISLKVEHNPNLSFDGDNNSYTYNMTNINKNVEIEVVFAKDQYKLSETIGDNGTIETEINNEKKTNKDYTIDAASNVTCTIKPNEERKKRADPKGWI